ncbi:N-acetyl-gamma-glutamyl-phosphate reductase [Sansalvadorimonas verongulae]|uniref:N-acetyl-gamma-glutamyl-phosphate reductase n=1 Tax=Sansalvadorimonas verongulae TaxID=2172824 RepID=UPI002E3349BB|nr:N-acetyl-gamma-glutamyl-phosphate reductase [Sansalvadorimonas verongulae]MTI13175.1 N-acetyl-gamma-glutamyl-phosphate reductase [Sansalvadorimonas verongulae]
MIKAGIVGGTGYTGVELLRLLSRHPQVNITAVTSRAEAGRRVDELYPNLRGHIDHCFTAPDIETLAACDIVFFATPNGVAMKQVPELMARGVRVVDLAADFRIKDVGVWSQWYGMDHACPDWVAEAVYGLPEFNREAIARARLIANPGCYPTAVQLGYKPLLDAGLIHPESLVADCKSGVSGAGRGASVGTLLCEAGDSFHAYGVAGHRHKPEIEQGLASMSSGAVKQFTFVPHLLPMIRGIHATLYARLDMSQPDLSQEYLQSLYEKAYENEPFVDVMPLGSLPETRSVRGSNQCRIAIYRPGDGDTVVVLSVIDNLVKGASGQAVQNMNVMFGLPEEEGLDIVGLLP